MDVTYNASSQAKANELVAALSSKGYKVTSKRLRDAFPYAVRVWRVEPADEQTVINAILTTDPGARPVKPPPSYTHG